MKRRLVLVGAILLLAIPLAFLLRDVTRQVFLLQVLRLAWNVRLLFESLPQTWLWIALVAVALLIVVKTMSARRGPRLPEEAGVEEQAGRISTLARQIQRSWEFEYSRRSLARDMRVLVLEVLAYEHRRSTEDLWQELRDGKLDVPPEILEYLSPERWPGEGRVPNFFGWLKHRLWSRARAPRTDPRLERVVQFLELELGGRFPPEDQAQTGGIA